MTDDAVVPVDDDDSVIVVTSVDELEPLSDEFAAQERRWRGFALTLQRQIARATARMKAKIDDAFGSRESAGHELARTVLANRQLVAGDATEVVLNNTTVTFYDGKRGEFKVLNEEKLALFLIAHNQKPIVEISAKVVYTIDTDKLKKQIKDDPELMQAVLATGLATYASNKTVTISTALTPGEKKRGVTPSKYVFKIPE